MYGEKVCVRGARTVARTLVIMCLALFKGGFVHMNWYIAGTEMWLCVCVDIYVRPMCLVWLAPHENYVLCVQIDKCADALRKSNECIYPHIVRGCHG